MKSTITIQRKPASLDYPKLMISDNSKTVVLFQSPKNGIVVHVGSDGWPISHHSEKWAMCDFKDYIGIIELSN